ncbi:hypothetical protein RRG08_037388 [Elysia crispata]|uniref:Uncharacterized protein n=1 Tax=Elysia crispata TaxID=231223 RepID=A0AAE1AFJ4_9GAST|nr:hypothetical protein RRG08_037388 [Elysia crispata]
MRVPKPFPSLPQPNPLFFISSTILETSRSPFYFSNSENTGRGDKGTARLLSAALRSLPFRSLPSLAEVGVNRNERRCPTVALETAQVLPSPSPVMETQEPSLFPFNQAFLPGPRVSTFLFPKGQADRGDKEDVRCTTRPCLSRGSGSCLVDKLMAQVRRRAGRGGEGRTVSIGTSIEKKGR